VKSCWELSLKGPLARALKTEITLDERDTLLAFMASLPDGALGASQEDE
jgi:hypothetical protein